MVQSSTWANLLCKTQNGVPSIFKGDVTPVHVKLPFPRSLSLRLSLIIMRLTDLLFGDFSRTAYYNTAHQK